MLELAVVGSGIGGSLIAALNKDKNTILFEKDKNLGGCASTFKRGSNHYNAGATTLVGYEDGHVLKKHFDMIGVRPDITKSEVAIRVVQGEKVVDRIKDFEEFLDSVERNYPNKNNRIFWTKIKEIDEKFWKLQKIYYAKYSLKNYVKTAAFVNELLFTYGFDLFKSARVFIKQTLGEITPEYENFIDSQLMITIQTKSKDISILSLALGLSYPFHDVFYVNGGMGTLIEEIVKEVEVKRDEAIQKILREGDSWIVESKKGSYKTKDLILNSSIYQCADLFDDEAIKRYYNSFSFSDQSAFVLYLTLESDVEFLDHYQLIYEDLLPNSTSNSFFISFSKRDDHKLSTDGYSVTISTHTKANLWRGFSKQQYKEQKQITQEFIIEKFLEYFSMIKKQQIKKAFSATSITYNRYIGRYNCGGKAISYKNITELPSNNTPFSGLYNVGDTVFAAQGWPGVALGVDVLQRQLNGSS